MDSIEEVTLKVSGADAEFSFVHWTDVHLSECDQRDEALLVKMARRADAFGGDFLKDSLPEGADLVTLIRVAHDHPDAHVNIILRAIFKAASLASKPELQKNTLLMPDNSTSLSANCCCKGMW